MSSRVPASISIIRAFCPCALGGVVAYSFANPDDDNIYDIFPVQKTKHCFISLYKVPRNNQETFQNKWKELARFYQLQEGYLFNKLIRSHELVDGESYLYLDYNQWANGETYKAASSRERKAALASQISLLLYNDITPPSSSSFMYKKVVDDTQYTPSEVLQSRSPDNLADRLNDKTKLV